MNYRIFKTDLKPWLKKFFFEKFSYVIKAITGTIITITDGIRKKVNELKLSKESSQETTTGKNLFNINGDVNTRYDGTTTTNNTVSGNDLTTITNGSSTHIYGQKIYVGTGNTVTMSVKLKSITYTTEPGENSTVAYMSLYNDNTTTGQLAGSYKYSEVGTIKTLTFVATTDYIYATFGRTPATTSATFTDIQVEIGQATSYEPYTNGPSPNPDFPQDVKTVTGYRNLFDNTITWSGTSYGKVNYNPNDDTFTFHRDSGSDYLINYETLSLKPNTSYKLYFDVSENTMTSEFRNIILSSYFNSGTFSIPAGKTGIFSATLRTGTSAATYDLWLYCSSTGTLKAKIMLIEGTQLLPYIPYGTNWLYIKNIGKNLFDINNLTGYYPQNSLSYEIENNSITLEAIGTTGTQSATYVFDGFDETKNYTLSFKAKKLVAGEGSYARIQITIYGSNDGTNFTTIKTVSENTPVVNQEYSLSWTVSGYKYYRFLIYNDASQPVQLGEKTQYYDIIFAEGTATPTYEPYQKTIILIPLNNNEVCGIGTYKDELIVDKNGHCWLNKKIGKMIFVGTEIWSTDGDFFYTTDYGKIGSSAQFLCNYAIYKSKQPATALTEFYLTTSGSYFPEFSKYNFTDKDNFKTWLTTHNIIVYYPLIEESLINLNYTVDIRLFKGTNNISNSDDMDMSIKYYSK